MRPARRWHPSSPSRSFRQAPSAPGSRGPVWNRSLGLLKARVRRPRAPRSRGDGQPRGGGCARPGARAVGVGAEVPLEGVLKDHDPMRGAVAGHRCAVVLPIGVDLGAPVGHDDRNMIDHVRELGWQPVDRIGDELLEGGQLALLRSEAASERFAALDQSVEVLVAECRRLLRATDAATWNEIAGHGSCADHRTGGPELRTRRSSLPWDGLAAGPSRRASPGELGSYPAQLAGIDAAGGRRAVRARPGPRAEVTEQAPGFARHVALMSRHVAITSLRAHPSPPFATRGTVEEIRDCGHWRTCFC